MEKTKQVFGKGTAWLSTGIISFSAFIMFLFFTELRLWACVMAGLSLYSVFMLGESAKDTNEGTSHLK